MVYCDLLALWTKDSDKYAYQYVYSALSIKDIIHTYYLILNISCPYTQYINDQNLNFLGGGTFDKEFRGSNGGKGGGVGERKKRRGKREDKGKQE